MNYTDDQQAAYALAMAWAEDKHGDDRFFCIGGAAGTGKTTLLGWIKRDLESTARDVRWCATTGKASQRLAEVINVKVRTLHSLLYSPPDIGDDDELIFKDLQPSPGADTIVVVEEASMISPKLYEDMQEWAQEGTRFLLVGDHYQLPPVINKQEEKTYGADFTVFLEHPGHFMSEVVRSTDSIAELANSIREQGKLSTVTDGPYEYRRAHVRTAIEDWLNRPDDHVLVTWRNALRMKANDFIRRQLGHDGLPNIDEQVLFCRNSHNVLNGTIGTVKTFNDGPILDGIKTHDVFTEHGWTRVTCAGRNTPMDGAAPKIADWGKYKDAVIAQMIAERAETGNRKLPPKFPVPITWGYTMTAHKAQGSEWDRVTVLLSNGDTENRFFHKRTMLPNGESIPFAIRWIYTAITRARKRVTVVIGPE
jgi:exodeoxyribonuclease-5